MILLNIIFEGKPIAVSCAYSGRVAVSYRNGNVRVDEEKPENKFVNLCVSIYECESTGIVVNNPPVSFINIGFLREVTP